MTILYTIFQYVEEVFHLVLPYWFPPSSFLVRAGALYTLYGLYHLQLTVPKVKVGHSRVIYKLTL